MAALETVKKVENAVLMKDAQGNPFIRLDNVRFSFPFFGTPSDDTDDNGNVVKSYRGVAMLPKSTHKAAKELVKETILKLIAEQQKKDPKIKVPVSHWFLSDGDEKEDELMHGHFLVSASDKKYRPKARDRKGHIIDEIEKIDEIFYGGAWGSMLIRPWYFSGISKKNPGKPLAKRIVAGLAGVMFLKDDTPFGAGRVDDEDAWDVPGGGDDDGDGMGDDDDSI